jgi:HPt (histidine-containing phosphotransfer) domain-containing protein
MEDTIQNEHVLDEEVLAQLRELGGEDDPEFLNSVIDQFLDDGPVRIRAIRQAVESANAEALTKAAHSLKGSCQNIGAKIVGLRCLTLEEMGRTGTMTNGVNTLRELEGEFERTCRALEQEKTQTVGTPGVEG